MNSKIPYATPPSNFRAATVRRTLSTSLLFLICGISLAVARPAAAIAQRNQTLFGDIKIRDSKSGVAAPLSVTIILYKDAGGEVGRQSVSNGSRYRFTNLTEGDYQIAIEADNNEIARMRMVIGGLSNSPYGFQQDLEFDWKPNAETTKAGVLSSADVYNRSAPNKSLFQKAQEAVDKKKYDQAITFLKQIVENDKLDFQSWTLLGTIYLQQEKQTEAEKAYLSALESKPTFVIALIDLGRLRLSQKKAAEAIDPLTKAVEAQPQSAEANYQLGEAYLQVKKGSKAIPYLNEAARLGRLEAHLRLGWLYNAAGLKDKAAAEYEEFLKKNPAYADRNKLQEYITANKKE